MTTSHLSTDLAKLSPGRLVNLPCISTLRMRGRVAPDGSRRVAGSASAQLLPGPAAVCFWFSCAARSGVLYWAPKPQVTRDAWGFPLRKGGQAGGMLAARRRDPSQNENRSPSCFEDRDLSPVVAE